MLIHDSMLGVETIPEYPRQGNVLCAQDSESFPVQGESVNHLNEWKGVVGYAGADARLKEAGEEGLSWGISVATGRECGDCNG